MDLVTYALLKSKISSVSSKLDVLAAGFDYKGSVSDNTDLPSGASVGDMYTVASESNQQYVWDGEDWIQIAAPGTQYAVVG